MAPEKALLGTPSIDRTADLWKDIYDASADARLDSQ